MLTLTKSESVRMRGSSMSSRTGLFLVRAAGPTNSGQRIASSRRRRFVRAKGAGSYSASKRSDDEFPYDPVGVFRLLKEIHRLDARLVPGADYDTAVIIRDLKDSLDVPGLTTRQRQVMALYFFTSSTLEETGAI